MCNWAQSEVFNWATAEYSIMIKLKGSPYYHDYVDQGTILDRVVGSSRVRNIENISVPLELTCFFGSKTLRLIPFFEQNFHSLDQMVLFLDLDCQNLASLDFDNCPISKKDHLISEMKISLSEMKLRLRVFPPQSKSIPEVQNIYSSPEKPSYSKMMTPGRRIKVCSTARWEVTIVLRRAKLSDCTCFIS